MKKIIAEEVECEGLTKLLGETVTIFCACYIYTGNQKCGWCFIQTKPEGQPLPLFAVNVGHNNASGDGLVETWTKHK